MTITIETSDMAEIEQLLKVLKSLNINDINIQNMHQPRQPFISKGNKDINPEDLFGIWKDNPMTIEQIRSTAWKRQ